MSPQGFFYPPHFLHWGGGGRGICVGVVGTWTQQQLSDLPSTKILAVGSPLAQYDLDRCPCLLGGRHSDQRRHVYVPSLPVKPTRLTSTSCSAITVIPSGA